MPARRRASKNGILLDKGIALIDLDQASVGPPAADLGSLLAALRYERHIGLLTEPAERTLADTFLAGYQQIGMLPGPESLRWHMQRHCSRNALSAPSVAFVCRDFSAFLNC